LGSAIARELVKQGHTVRIMVRRSSRLDGVASLPIERTEGDVLDRASLDRALVGMDALIHTAGHTGARRRDKKAVYAVNVEGVRHVYEAVRAYNPRMRVVHTSSIAAVGASREPRLLDENTAWDLGESQYHYVVSKRQGEEHAIGVAHAGGNVVVLCPGMILGPGDVYGTYTARRRASSSST
jgi:dihydroflavonol-4-reductase